MNEVLTEFNKGAILNRQELTEAEKQRIALKRQQAIDLQKSRVVANDRNVYVGSKRTVTLTQMQDSGGGFFVEPASSSQPELVNQYDKSEEDYSDEDNSYRKKKKRKKRREVKKVSGLNCDQNQHKQGDGLLSVPLPPDVKRPVCDECDRPFSDSFLLANFDCQVCDICRDPKGIHCQITRTTAKEIYLLNDVDLDIRDPPLRCILKRNPRNTTWGDMRLYLEAQVAERCLSVWGSEQALEEERERRVGKREKAKLKGFKKKVKELRLQVRSSLFSQKSESHEHDYGDEEYDKESDEYSKQCPTCQHVLRYEKI